MAISWKRREKNDGRENWLADGVSHEGLVMSTSWATCTRVMSDIYADVYYCRVWNPEKSKAEVVSLGAAFECESRRGSVDSVDCDPDILAAYDAEEARKAEVRRIAERAHSVRVAEAAAERELKAVRKGIEVVVVKGRKVPRGTRGIVRWEGGNDYGSRIGISVPGEDKLVYTAPSNCEAIVAGLEPGETPEGGWVDLLKTTEKAEAARDAALPARGDRVRVLDCGTEGTVFWAKDGRYGIDPRPAGSKGRCETPIWANIAEIEDVNGAAAMPEPVAAATADAGLAYPYNHVRTLRLEAGVWKAFSENDVHLLDLTTDGALRLLCRTSEINVG
jgi:uncharacterized protein YdaU (DUF1376 family)